MTLYQNCSNNSAPLNNMAARTKNRKTFKRLLLNQRMDFVITIQECFLGDPLPKLHKQSRYVEQGGGRVVRWCWVNLQCRGVLLIWIMVGQGPIALAVGAGGGCLVIFFSSIISLFFLPISGRRPDID